MRTLREVVDMNVARASFPRAQKLPENHTKERNEDRFGRKSVWSSAAAGPLPPRRNLCEFGGGV